LEVKREQRRFFSVFVGGGSGSARSSLGIFRQIVVVISSCISSNLNFVMSLFIIVFAFASSIVFARLISSLLSPPPPFRARVPPTARDDTLP
jgi:uncharacterized membrane protein